MQIGRHSIAEPDAASTASYAQNISKNSPRTPVLVELI